MKLQCLTNGAKLSYKVCSEGDIKVKIIGNAMNTSIRKPYIENLKVKNGDIYHIDLSVSSIKGISGEILEKEKKIEKLKNEDLRTN